MPVLSVIHKTRFPVKIWSPMQEVEVEAIKQLEGIASLPFVFKHVAAMPDVHLGKGATVGSVVATKGAICPCAVGVDIGCGMHALKTDIDRHSILDQLPEIRSMIESLIPLGHESNKALSPSVEAWEGWRDLQGISIMDQSLLNRARLQLGSLGGGNHFIEICLDTEGAVWIMLHSGSRNLGKVVAERHITSAKNLMKQMFIELPDPELAYLVQGTKEFDAYWQDLQLVQSYALENRNEMMRRIIGALSQQLGRQIQVSMQVNCHHNYASLEHHYGENVIITRKGAVRAHAGGLGIIPGSMGAKSYIVRGLGNRESFESCSHGAGRKMSRSEAKRRYSLTDLAEATSGVECRKDLGVIDEIPLAYKDIDKVMENQKDLVEIVATLKQVLCIKG